MPGKPPSERGPSKDGRDMFAPLVATMVVIIVAFFVVGTMVELNTKPQPCPDGHVLVDTIVAKPFCGVAPK